MVKICNFCECVEEDGAWVYNTYKLCPACEKLKNISRCYSMDLIVEKVEQIFIRDKKPIENRTEAIAKECLLKLRNGKKVEKATKM